MEEFGAFVMGAFLVVLFLVGTAILAVVLTNINLSPTSWKCTESMVTSGRDVLPVEQTCTQYTMKPKRD